MKVRFLSNFYFNLRKTNNNVLIYKHYYADGSEGVKIVGKYTGTTVVSLIDSELNEVFQGIDLEKIEDENYINSLIIGYVENDPYLIEQVDLQNNLKDLSFELNPIRKIKKLEKFADSLKIISNLKSLDYSKILDQINERGWSKASIEQIIKKPKKIGKSTNNYQGANSPATVYYNSNNEYVVIENSTNKIIQISNINDTNWIIDSRIYDLKNY